MVLLSFLATCPGTIDNDFRRKSSSSVRGIAPAEGFDKALLSVDDGQYCRVAALRHHRFNSFFAIHHSHQRDNPSLLTPAYALPNNAPLADPVRWTKLDVTGALLQATAERYCLLAQLPVSTGLLASRYAFEGNYREDGQKKVRVGVVGTCRRDETIEQVRAVVMGS